MASWDKADNVITNLLPYVLFLDYKRNNQYNLRYKKCFAHSLILFHMQLSYILDQHSLLR